MAYIARPAIPPRMTIESLRDSFRGCPVVDRGGYRYVVHPLTDGVPAIEPGMLADAVSLMAEAGDFDCDAIVAPETMGAVIAAPLGLLVRKPVCIVRKRRYGLPGERELAQRTGYSGSAMYVNGLRRGDRVTVVDDVLSTGGTMSALLGALRDIGCAVVDVVVLLDKSEGPEAAERACGRPVTALVRAGEVGIG